MVCEWQSLVRITDTSDDSSSHSNAQVLLPHAGVPPLDSPPWSAVFAVIDDRFFNRRHSHMFIDVLPFMVSVFTSVGAVSVGAV